MSELKIGSSVKLTNDSSAKIVNELGRGGQGIVYQVEVGGQQMALKWYSTNPISGSSPDNESYDEWIEQRE